MTALSLLVAQTSSPTPTPTSNTPPASGIETVGAIVAIALALAAAVVGYRVIRGGRGI